MISGKICKEVITSLNQYASRNIASKYLKQELTSLQRKVGKSQSKKNFIHHFKYLINPADKTLVRI